MQVRIDDEYSVEELRVIVRCLIDNGVITESEAPSEHELEELKINFLNTSDLLVSASNSLVHYSIDDCKGEFDQSETSNFYEWLTLELLRGSPLRNYSPNCGFSSDLATSQETFVITAGAHSITIHSQSLNHPELVDQLVAGVNQLLADSSLGAGFYPIGWGEGSAFLLLQPQQYQRLLKERVLLFEQVEYPEIEAWRSITREEDCLF